MIPKNCKPLAEAVFRVAWASGHAAREWPAQEQVQAGATEPKLEEPLDWKRRQE